jgi:hypothetical protein
MRPLRRERDRAPRIRSSSPPMIAVRSASLMSRHVAISEIERPQPMHRADAGSITQIFTQGVDISGADIGFI